MNPGTQVARWPRLRPARTASAIIATAVLGLLTACSGSPSSASSGGSPAAGGSAGSPSAVAYSACIRSREVPNFPDPTNGGSSGPICTITKAGISDAASHASQFEAKLTECGRLAGANAPESLK